MLLAPSAQSIWSSSRRKAGYVLFPGMSEIRFAVTMEGSLCQASSSCRPCTANHVLPRADHGLPTVLRRQRGSRDEVDGAYVQTLQAVTVRFSKGRLSRPCQIILTRTSCRAGPPKQLYSYLRPRHELLLSCIETVSSAWVGEWPVLLLDLCMIRIAFSDILTGSLFFPSFLGPRVHSGRAGSRGHRFVHGAGGRRCRQSGATRDGLARNCGTAIARSALCCGSQTFTGGS